MRKLNPGDIAPISGRYKIVDEKGNCLDVISCDKGNRLPPTQSSDYYYEIEE